MKPKIYISKNGASVFMEKLATSGLYLLILRSASGTVIDKTRCDTWGAALEYWKAFKKQADVV